MRIVLNRFVTFGVKTGVGHYTEQLWRSLQPRADGVHIDAFPTGWLRRACALIGRVRPSAGQGALTRRSSWSARLRQRLKHYARDYAMTWIGRRFQSFCEQHDYDLYHEPNFIPLPCARPTVVTLHDLSVLTHPEWHPKDRVKFYERHFPGVLAQAAHFITVSDCVREEVLRVLRVAPDRVTRVYNGVRAAFRPRPHGEVVQTLQRLGLPTQYFLCVGTIEPRKNVLRLLQAYCALPESFRRQWPMLLVGSWGWKSREVAEYLDAEARHRGVRYVGYMPEQQLPYVYNGARALLYPSHYEGFGLPPMEMMACGGAVIASTAAALVETTAGRAFLVHPDDVDGWRSAMMRAATDNEWWRLLRQGVQETARSFTWERCAAETLTLYKRLVVNQQLQRDVRAA